MTAPPRRGRPPLGRSVRLGSIRVTPATATKWTALQAPGETANDTFERLVEAATDQENEPAVGRWFR